MDPLKVRNPFTDQNQTQHNSLRLGEILKGQNSSSADQKGPICKGYNEDDENMTSRAGQRYLRQSHAHGPFINSPERVNSILAKRHKLLQTRRRNLDR
jgi:hypothetical protein